MKSIFRQILCFAWLLLALGCQGSNHTWNEVGKEGKTASDIAGNIGGQTLANTCVLDNSKIRTVVDASIGRIVWFGPSGGSNLLWQLPSDQIPSKGYINHGGDKVWPAMQPLWRRINGKLDWPPPAIDGMKWQITQCDRHHLVMQSPVCPASGVQITRRITLEDNCSMLRIENRMTRVVAKDLPVTIWCVAQIRIPDQVWMQTILPSIASYSHSYLPTGTDAYWRILSPPGSMDSSQVNLRSDHIQIDGNELHDKEVKLGSMGCWLAADYGDGQWVQCVDWPLSEGYYPDASNLQVYCNGRYMELERLSPQVSLQAGDSMVLNESWYWLETPEKTSPSMKP